MRLHSAASKIQGCSSLHISASDVILLAHAFFGATGCLGALWVFVEALNAEPRKHWPHPNGFFVDGGLHSSRVDLWRILVSSVLSSGKGAGAQRSLAVRAQYLYGD